MTLDVSRPWVLEARAWGTRLEFDVRRQRNDIIGNASRMDIPTMTFIESIYISLQFVANWLYRELSALLRSWNTVYACTSISRELIFLYTMCVFSGSINNCTFTRDTRVDRAGERARLNHEPIAYLIEAGMRKARLSRRYRGAIIKWQLKYLVFHIRTRLPFVCNCASSIIVRVAFLKRRLSALFFQSISYI